MINHEAILNRGSWAQSWEAKRCHSGCSSLINKHLPRSQLWYWKIRSTRILIVSPLRRETLQKRRYNSNECVDDRLLTIDCFEIAGSCTASMRAFLAMDISWLIEKSTIQDLVGKKWFNYPTGTGDFIPDSLGLGPNFVDQYLGGKM